MKTKKVFTRIWRTFVIITNTIWVLLATMVNFAYILNGGYGAEEAIQRLSAGFVVLLMTNLVDYISRKNFTNY